MDGNSNSNWLSHFSTGPKCCDGEYKFHIVSIFLFRIIIWFYSLFYYYLHKYANCLRFLIVLQTIFDNDLSDTILPENNTKTNHLGALKSISTINTWKTKVLDARDEIEIIKKIIIKTAIQLGKQTGKLLFKWRTRAADQQNATNFAHTLYEALWRIPNEHRTFVRKENERNQKKKKNTLFFLQSNTLTRIWVSPSTVAFRFFVISFIIIRCAKQ